MAISLVGNIGFFGLIAPYRETIVRGSYAKKLLMSAMIGAISIVIADLIGRTFLPKEVPRCIYCCVWRPILHILIINREKVITILSKQNDLTTTLAKCLSLTNRCEVFIHIVVVIVNKHRLSQLHKYFIYK